MLIILLILCTVLLTAVLIVQLFVFYLLWRIWRREAIAWKWPDFLHAPWHDRNYYG
jgi:hypothetical protein